MDHQQVDKRNQLFVLKGIHHGVMVEHTNPDQSLWEKNSIVVWWSMNVPIIGVDFDFGVSAEWFVGLCPSPSLVLSAGWNSSSRRCKTSRGTLQPHPFRSDNFVRRKSADKPTSTGSKCLRDIFNLENQEKKWRNIQTVHIKRRQTTDLHHWHKKRKKKNATTEFIVFKRKVVVHLPDFVLKANKEHCFFFGRSNFSN